MKKTVLFVSMIVILLLSFSAVQAEDNLTASNGEKTFDTIQQTINSSDDFSVIELDGTYSGNSKAINIDKPITIKGTSNEAVLDAKENSQILTVSADDVVIENLKFVRGTSRYVSSFEYGGAIYATGNNLKIINCTFINNYASYGAAICTFGENVSIIDCKFSSNTAQSSGGAIELDGDNNHVTNCIFNDNMAGHVGGAVAWVGNNGVLSNSVFDNMGVDSSKSSQFGGAVVWMGANGTLSQSKFSNFNSKKSGAAIYWKGTGGSLNYCIFEKNNSPCDMAYFGNPENADCNYWGSNFNSNESFIESNMIYYNDSFTSPKNWVNIKEDANSISFVLSDDGVLEKYLPDYYYKGMVISKNQHIIQKSSNILASNVVTYSLYNGKSLKITLKSGNDALANKNIQIKLNGVVYDKVTNKDGVVDFKINLKNSKVYNALISFKGDTWYKSSSKNVQITVKKQKPKLTIKTTKKVVKVVLKDQFKRAISKKFVKLSIGKKTYKAKTNSKGIVKFKIKLKDKKTYSYKVKFSGNAYYKSVSKSGKIRVK